MTVETVYGVDFSGASQAGKKIWVTEGEPTEDGELHIESVQRVGEFLNVGSRDRTVVLPALLRAVLEEDESAVFGFDFPFSLPEEILPQTNWETFVTEFPDEFLSPENLQRVCSNRARLVTDSGSKQLKRQTERDSDALCSYNLQISKQTYYGIRDLLRPLVLTEAANILPMIDGIDGAPVVAEVYPASTLNTLGLPDSGYKSRGSTETRREILDGIVDETDDVDEEILVNDSEGDGIDSIVAAKAVTRNLEKLGSNGEVQGKPVSGRIYV